MTGKSDFLPANIGLIRNGDGYTNDLYGETDVELDISVVSGIGDIELRVAE